MYDIIINPIAGGKPARLQKNVALIEKRFKEKNVDYKIHYSEYKGHPKILTEELIAAGATDIVCVGGDGTLHNVVNGFSNFEKVNLGLIPCGTGNDFATSLKLPSEITKCVDIIIDGKPQYTDFLQLPGIRCINIVGIGLDVEVLKKYEALKKKTKMSYTKCLLKTLLKFEYTNFTAKSPEREEKYSSFIAAVANGCDYGGGLPISPNSKPYDGLLDFVAIRKLSKFGILNALLKLKKGEILNLKKTDTFRASEIKIITDKPMAIDADGELYENIPFEVKLIHNTLKMYR